MAWGRLVSYFGFILVTLVLLFLPYLFSKEEIPNSGESTLRVMTYSSFIRPWAAGPELARLFKEESGITIEWINAGNAGLILERLRFRKDSDRPDMVIGLDQFSIFEARKYFDWQDMTSFVPKPEDNLLPKGARFSDFMAYDWGPMTFVFRRGEVNPPQSLDDLLLPDYRGRLILQDPRMSSPGLQFFLWVLSLKGEEEGLAYLRKLKPSIQLISPSWSSSYSIFKSKPGSLVFSYFSSPYYHQEEETESEVEAAFFQEPHPLQVEYVGIPSFCVRCKEAQLFARFLLRTDVQKLVMEKNYMYPVNRQAMADSVFQLPPAARFLEPVENATLINNKKQLVNQWKKVFY